MTSASALLRSLVIYGVCLPLAIFLGYLLASPPDPGSFVFVGVLLFILLVPLLLRWHQAWLIAGWNFSAVLFFLPGRPPLWMGLTAVSLTISIIHYALRRERNFIRLSSFIWPLLLLALVTLATAELTGGVGLRSFGGEVYGGKRYVYILAAIAGFFAIACRPIPREKGGLYVALFFLGGATLAIGNLAGRLPASLNWIFAIFPVENALSFSTAFVADNRLMVRLGGLTTIGLGVYCAMLARSGLTEFLSFRSPFKLAVLLACMFVGLLGGYRSLLIQFVLIGAFLFYLEGLYRSRWLPALILGSIMGAVLIGSFAKSLPLSVQRTLAFLPVEIDPEVKMDAVYSSEWRLQMWNELLPQIPRYLLVGKGYAMGVQESELIGLATRGGEGFEGSELTTDYHSGPLSVILPLGLPGTIAFLWLLGLGARVVYRNHRYGDPEFRKLNTFLLAFFWAKVIYFTAVFGSLYVDLPTFTGVIALSISLNHGVAQPEAADAALNPEFNRIRAPLGLRGTPAPSAARS